MTRPLATVAQICSLLSRGFSIRRPCAFSINYRISTACRMQFGDTADCKSALHAPVQRVGVRPSSGAATLKLSARPNFSSALEQRQWLRPGRAHSGAFTLVELMVVIAIIGIMTAMMIPEMKGTFQDALLRSTSRELINVFDLAYSRAISLNQARRVRLDESSGRYLVEKKVIENGAGRFCSGRRCARKQRRIGFAHQDRIPSAGRTHRNGFRRRGSVWPKFQRDGHFFLSRRHG